MGLKARSLLAKSDSQCCLGSLRQAAAFVRHISEVRQLQNHLAQGIVLQPTVAGPRSLQKALTHNLRDTSKPRLAFRRPLPLSLNPFETGTELYASPKP